MSKRKTVHDVRKTTIQLIYISKGNPIQLKANGVKSLFIESYSIINIKI